MIDQKILYNFSDNTYQVIEFKTLSGRKMHGLISNNAIQSITPTDDKKFDLFAEYFYLYDLPLIINKNIKNSLVLGGGCFSYPKYYISNYQDKYMDCVEINKEMIDVALNYFFLNDLFTEYDSKKERLKIYNEDAKNYIKNCNNQYDYILLDIFKDNEPIDYFLTEHFTQRINNLLNKNGIYSINYIVNINQENKFYKYIETLKNIFENVFILTTKNMYNNNLGNVYIICSNFKITIPEDNKIIKINI